MKRTVQMKNTGTPKAGIDHSPNKIRDTPTLADALHFMSRTDSVNPGVYRALNRLRNAPKPEIAAGLARMGFV